MRFVNTGLSIPETDYRTVSYTAFLGTDFSVPPQETAMSRSPDAENMLIENGIPKKRPGWAETAKLSLPVLGLHALGDTVFVHAGRYLAAMRLIDGVPDYTQAAPPEWVAGKSYAPGDCVLYGGVSYGAVTQNADGAFTPAHWAVNVLQGTVYAGMNPAGRSASFCMGGRLYLLDGSRYSVVERSGSGFLVEAVTARAHVPVTGVLGYWDRSVTPPVWHDCTADEEKNLLTEEQINTFCGDGVSTEFCLTEGGCTVLHTWFLDTNTREWSVWDSQSAAEDTARGRTKVTFTAAPPVHPDGAGLPTVKVLFRRAADAGRSGQINRCTLAATYGYFNNNRVFLSGNPDYPNRDWASGTDDPTYMEENGWANIGTDAAAITGYLHCGDGLAILKEDNRTDAEIYIRTGSLQSDGHVLFPVQQGVKGVGAVSRYAMVNLRDDALFLADGGVYAVTDTDAGRQKTVQNRSAFIDSALAAETGKAQACAAVWNDRLLLCFPETGHAYIADARKKTGRSDTESYGYEWMRWTNIPAAFLLNHGGTLLFASGDTLYRFTEGVYTDAGAPVHALWSTNAQDFDLPGRYKTLLKQGTRLFLRAGGHVKISARTERGDTLLFNGPVHGSGIRAAAIRKKVPKARTVQLLIENNTAGEGLELYGLTLRCTPK